MLTDCLSFEGDVDVWDTESGLWSNATLLTPMTYLAGAALGNYSAILHGGLTTTTHPPVFNLNFYQLKFAANPTPITTTPSVTIIQTTAVPSTTPAVTTTSNQQTTATASTTQPPITLTSPVPTTPVPTAAGGCPLPEPQLSNSARPNCTNGVWQFNGNVNTNTSLNITGPLIIVGNLNVTGVGITLRTSSDAAINITGDVYLQGVLELQVLDTDR